jgi:chromosome segregation protein
MLDALVVEDEAALRDFLVKVAAAGEGAVRLIARQSSVAAAAVLPAGMVALAEHISPVSDEYREMVQRLLGSVAVVEGVDDVPADIAADCVVVTLDGILIHGDGRGEFWMGESGSTNPISRRNAVNAAQQAIEKIEADIATVEAELQKLSEQAESLEQQAGEARRSRDEARRQFAQQEGESRTVERESKTAAKRLETVSWELEELQNKGSGWETQKQELQQKQAETRESRERVSRRIAELNKEQQELEAVYNALQTELMEKKIAFSNADSRVGHIKTQLESSTNRINEINASLQGRSEGLKSYSENIDQLKAEIKSAQDQLEGLENAVKDSESRTKSLREERVKKSEVLSQHEHALAANRENLEKISRRKSELDVQLTESGMRRQTLLERVTGDYTLTLEQIFEEPEPEWDGDAPSVEEAETRVAELRAKLESMGPVNLVAIEEYQEHEERYTFLTQQEADLVKAKEQLLEMIKKINQTTSEMFRQTFEKANTNFQSMFTRLFNGGSAKLVLVNEEDVLDCGIEIVARPPGKRLQNISLLSGGERTLTAVALLFSIYQIKPSPFCMLDELDAPLDDTNIGRFIEVLKEFLKQSQFVVITHNRQTTAASSVIYGVTMPEQGVSRIMSMKFKDNKPDADAESEAADGDEPSEE